MGDKVRKIPVKVRQMSGPAAPERKMFANSLNSDSVIVKVFCRWRTSHANNRSQKEYYENIKNDFPKLVPCSFIGFENAVKCLT
jgi:hypothetical protein